MDAPRPVVGGTLGLFAPSSPFRADRFEAGLSILDGLGFSTKLHPQIHERNGFLAGSDAARVAAFHDLLDDPEVDALIAVRGGYGMHRILGNIDLEKVRRANKAIVGFSDVSALHLQLVRAGLIAIHGPVVTQLGDLGAADHEHLRRVLAGDLAGLTYSSDGPVIRGGVAQGQLFGGCLSVLTPLVGTPYLEPPADTILLLEDVGEAPYRIDRQLTHLRLAGFFDRVRGVALGDFVRCDPPREDEQTITDVLAERLGDLGIPVVSGLPFGHGDRNFAVPLGAQVELDATAGRLTVLGAKSA